MSFVQGRRSAGEPVSLPFDTPCAWDLHGRAQTARRNPIVGSGSASKWPLVRALHPAPRFRSRQAGQPVWRANCTGETGARFLRQHSCPICVHLHNCKLRASGSCDFFGAGRTAGRRIFDQFCFRQRRGYRQGGQPCRLFQEMLGEIRVLRGVAVRKSAEQLCRRGGRELSGHAMQGGH
jgi:hypothetical protein